MDFNKLTDQSFSLPRSPSSCSQDIFLWVPIPSDNFNHSHSTFKFGGIPDTLRDSLSPITVTLLAITTGLLLIYFFITNFLQDNFLDSLPGPKGIWPLGIAHKLWKSEERLNQMTSWAIKYKPCCAIKMGLNKIVFLTTTSSVQKLLSSSNSGHLNKGYGYEIFLPFWGDGLVLSHVDKWKGRRKLLARAFTVRSFLGYMHIYNQESRSLMEEFGKEFDDKSEGIYKPVDHIIWKHTLRVICGATMGTDIWDIEGSHNLPSILTQAKQLSMMRFTQPWLLKEWLWNLHPKSGQLKYIADSLHQFTSKVIELRKQKMATSHEDDKNYDPDNTHGMKKSFTSIIEEMIMADFDNKSLVEEVNTFVTSGYETTATTLQFVFFCLAVNPKHQEICRQEVDNVFDNVSLCPNDDLTFEAMAHMKYLERCIYETLRLYPPAAMYFRKLEAPLKIDERIELPTGINVGVFLPSLHRDPSYFPEPDIFDPNRFLQENSKDRSQYAYLPFSAGTRNCIGYKFGINEVKVMTARILRHFKIETSDTVDSVRILNEVVLTPERGYNFRFIKR